MVPKQKQLWFFIESRARLGEELFLEGFPMMEMEAGPPSDPSKWTLFDLAARSFMV